MSQKTFTIHSHFHSPPVSPQDSILFAHQTPGITFRAKLLIPDWHHVIVIAIMAPSAFEHPHVVSPTNCHTHTVIALHGRGSQGLEVHLPYFSNDRYLDVQCHCPADSM